MTLEELIQLNNLLSKLITQPDWNKASNAWAALVEARRQVIIEIRSLDESWKEL